MTKDLRQMNSIMSDIQALSNRLKDNPPVLKSIIDFYSREINQHQDSLLCDGDGQKVRPEVRDAVDSLRLRLQAALQDTQEVIKQVGHLESLAHMKEDLVSAISLLVMIEVLTSLRSSDYCKTGRTARCSASQRLHSRIRPP